MCLYLIKKYFCQIGEKMNNKEKKYTDLPRPLISFGRFVYQVTRIEEMSNGKTKLFYNLGPNSMINNTQESSAILNSVYDDVEKTLNESIKTGAHAPIKDRKIETPKEVVLGIDSNVRADFGESGAGTIFSFEQQTRGTLVRLTSNADFVTEISFDAFRRIVKLASSGNTPADLDLSTPDGRVRHVEAALAYNG